MRITKLQAAKTLLLFMVVSSTMLDHALHAQPSLPDKPSEVRVKPAEPNVADVDKIQGNWQIMSIDMGVIVIKREDNKKEWQATLDGEMFFNGDRSGQTGHSNAKFKHDETRNPKQITLYHDDGSNLVFRGIYTLEGNTLKMCMNGDGNSVCRPDEFITKKGQAVVITILRRMPDKN